MGAVALADMLLNIMTVVQAGFQLEAIVAKCKAMAAEGKSTDDISKYITNLRNAALGELEAELAKP